MRKKRQRAFAVLAALLVGVIAWSVLGPPSALERPVMDGQPIGHWLQRMASESGGDDRDEIRARLVGLGPAVVPPLLAALEDRPSAFKLKITPFLAKHFPPAYRWLWRRRPASNWMAAYTLAAMPPDPNIRDGLIRALRRMADKNADTGAGFYAAQGLGEHYTNDAAIVIPELRAALTVPHNNIAALAARALPRFGTNGLIVLPDLIKLLGSNDDYLIGHVAWSLGNFGRDASIALPALRAQMTNQDATARRRVAIAVWQIAPESGFPADVLLNNMKAGWAQERCMAADELRRYSPDHSSHVVDTFIELIRLGPVTTSGFLNYWHCRESAQRLGEMGASAKAALPTLREAENSSDEFVRKAASEARHKIEQAIASVQRTEPDKPEPK